MNLYIWGDRGCISYGGDALVVMARNLREARKVAAKSANWSFFRSHDDHTDDGALFTGKPDKIVRGRAYAAYFMFSE